MENVVLELSHWRWSVGFILLHVWICLSCTLDQMENRVSTQVVGLSQKESPSIVDTLLKNPVSISHYFIYWAELLTNLSLTIYLISNVHHGKFYIENHFAKSFKKRSSYGHKSNKTIIQMNNKYNQISTSLLINEGWFKTTSYFWFSERMIFHIDTGKLNMYKLIPLLKFIIMQFKMVWVYVVVAVFFFNFESFIYLFILKFYFFWNLTSGNINVCKD